MSEYYPGNPERYSEQEQNPEYQQFLEHHKNHEKDPLHTEESVARILKKIESEALSSYEIIQSSGTGPKDISYDTPEGVLAYTETQLRPQEQAISHIIHQPVIEITNEVAAATVARPYGLMYGGLTASLTSVITLLVCRHYGYTYNYLLALLAFAGGYLIGVLIELITIKSHRS